MALSKHVFSSYIKQFKFRELFNDMGWNNDRTKLQIATDINTYALQAVAEKSGFKILLCQPPDDGLIPDYNTRKKIETKVTKLFQEHLIIFYDAKQQEQIWQLVVRQTGKPTKVTETRYNITQDPELLYQRASGLFFEMDEEENITIVDVTQRVAANFHQNAEKVTKHFYDKFKKEHTSFLGFIKGIETKVDKDWYASLMLNRLMFCYFIQKKGFLDDNKNYLRDKLRACQEKKGKNKFYFFYKDFLLILFHEGLNEALQKDEVKVEIGKIPYLNGGLFDEHELEKMYEDIDIDDKAFEGVFDFFDEWEWHLDTRVKATGKDINPDVIGYIFEKYINDRAQMGAYYTKEDITEYISKNCVLPYLFDESKRRYPKAFAPGEEIWQRVKQSGDDYIYDAVKYGITHDDLREDIPQEIVDGLDPEQPELVEKRRAWNRTAPSDIALPTEIYREVIGRRKRYAEIRSKIKNGEINQINDFITYNLNIRQFVQDVIENTNDPDFLRHFYKTINSITILDPTCGSGAFLFAAMNILESLYEACIMRMRAFVEDEDRLNENDKKSFSNKYKFFRNVLAEIQNQDHPNLKYFIFKSIILQNLYGVDIMREAVEIAKLRLFLKLVATVDADYRKPNLGLEPLPDIDFNIRAGNTLIGFATFNQLEKLMNEDLEASLMKDEIIEGCEKVMMAYKIFKSTQLSDHSDIDSFKRGKINLEVELKKLNKKLNKLLHKQVSGLKYENWLVSHQPFHWFAEFYEIIHDKGGFDVIIGNPPYVGYTRKNKQTKLSVSDIYKIQNYQTLPCSNLYPFTIERSLYLMSPISKIGMIIPISAFANNSMETLQYFFKNKYERTYISSFHQRPAQLFEGVLQRLCIFISTPNSKNDKSSEFFTSGIYRWIAKTRDILFSNISYSKTHQMSQNHIVKIGSGVEKMIFDKFIIHKSLLSYIYKKGLKNQIHYRTAGGGYWVTILNTPFDSSSLSNKNMSFDDPYNAKVFSAVLNSNLFWWYYSVNFDLFNFKDYMLFGFKFDYPSYQIELKITALSDEMEKSLLDNATYYTISSKTRGANETITYNKDTSKQIMDSIDTVLADHYGFTQEELDFIINYDIKYRMGKELGNEKE